MKIELLGKLVSIKTGKLNANAEVINGRYPFFTCSKEEKYIDSFAFDGEYILVAGNGILNVKYYVGRFNAYQRTYAIKPGDKIYGKYLYYFLESYVGKLRDLAIGGVIKYIKLANLTDAKIPLPSLQTQKRIAQILDDAAALRDKTEQLLEEYDALAQSIFLDMFGDPVTNPLELIKVELKNITDISSGSTPSRKNDSYWNGNIPWVKTGEVNSKLIIDTEEKITQQGLNNSSCKIFPKGSLIIAMYGQGKTRGQVAVLGIDATTNQACAVLQKKSEKINFNYLYELLKISYNDLRELGRGGNQPNLNVGLIKSYKVLLPPIELQNEFAEKIALIEKQKELAKQELQESEDLFNALLQKAFKGELV